MRQAPGGQASAESIRNKKRVIKMVLIVIVIFALSWLPIQIVLVLRYVILDQDENTDMSGCYHTINVLGTEWAFLIAPGQTF